MNETARINETDHESIGPCPTCGADQCLCPRPVNAPLPELQPCPFCGGPADLSKFTASAQGSFLNFPTHYVSCHPCGIVISGSSEAEAAAKWNKRVIAQDADVYIEIPLHEMRRNSSPQAQQTGCSSPCKTCCALLEIGSLFCAHCRATKFSQFLAPVSSEEMPLPSPEENSFFNE